VPDKEKEDRKRYEEWKLKNLQTTGEQNDHLREEIRAIEELYRAEIMTLRRELSKQQDEYPSYLNSSYTSPRAPSHKYIEMECEEDDNNSIMRNRKKREDDSDSTEEASEEASERASERASEEKLNEEEKTNEDKIQLHIKTDKNEEKEESYHESVDNLPV
jgi:hypothetical protein